MSSSPTSTESLQQKIRDVQAKLDAAKTSSDPGEKRLQKEYAWYLSRLEDRLKVTRAAVPETLPVEPRADTAPQLKCERTAMLVIHGIGEQSPYETLDQFSRNLFRYLRFEGGMADLNVSPRHMDHNDWHEGFVRLSTERHGPGGKPALIDVHEFYWAPATEGKMSYSEVITWLMKTAWATIRRFGDNVAEQKEAAEWDPGSGLDPRGIFRREVTRVVLLYLPLIGFLTALLGWLAIPTTRGFGLRGLLSHLWGCYAANPVSAISGTILFFLGLRLALPVFQQIWRWFLRNKRQHSSSEDHLWVVGQAVASATFLAIGGYLLVRAGFWELVRSKDLLLVVSGLLAQTFRSVMQNFVADVAVYTNLDEKAKNYTARQLILEGATTAIARLLREQVVVTREGGRETLEYDAVIVAGHSLGTVIAYDSLNHLCNHASGGPDQIVGKLPIANITGQDMQKITGLVTFGSPLDKVYYFFRENIPSHQGVRAQLVSYLFSLRKMPSGRDFGIYQFSPGYEPNRLDALKWYNAWSRDDPISGALHFYGPMEREEFRYLIPLYAHLSYWEDLRFYDFFAAPLLLGTAARKVYKARAAAV